MVKRMPPYSIWCRSPVTRFSISRICRRSPGGPISRSPSATRIASGCLGQCIVTDRVVARRRLLDETHNVIVVDLDKTQIRGLLQGRIAASELVERPI